MQKMKNEFEIPFDIKNDLLYCQRALTSHILVHQKIASCAPFMKTSKGQRQKSLLEKEIIDIGDEQKLLFNRLRFFIDYYQLTKNAKLGERERLTNLVRDELSHFARSSLGDLKPMNVQSRLSENALYLKYFRNDEFGDSCSSRDNSSENSVSDDTKIETISDDEHFEIIMPDEHYEQKVYAGPRQKATKPPQKLVIPNRTGQSLLKPIHQRQIEENEVESFHIQVVRPEIGIKKVEKDEKPVENQPLSLSRMRLSAALSKAKDATKSNAQLNRISTKSPESVRPVPEVKYNTPLSSSQSSNASSSVEAVEMEPVRDEEDPSELGQENFLRLFQLCTPAYTEYLMNRRPQRKRRTCTSTERMDFHYGKFELFEKQFANKRNKKQFLYSPPATRAKRRVGSNGSNSQAKEQIPSKRSKGIKSNSSSSSISSNGSSHLEKVCVTCYKRNNLLQCRACCGQYHAGCHTQATDVVRRKNFCPVCVRQNKMGNIKTSIKLTT